MPDKGGDKPKILSSSFDAVTSLGGEGPRLYTQPCKECGNKVDDKDGVRTCTVCGDQQFRTAYEQHS